MNTEFTVEPIKIKKVVKRNHDRAVIAYRLRNRGLTSNEIAEHLKINSSKVKGLVILGERLDSLTGGN